MDVSDCTVFCTEGLLYLARQADKHRLNRRVVTERLANSLDPNGVHLVRVRLPHNDTEWRMSISAKLRNSKDPAQFWLDCSFEDYDKVARKAEDMIAIRRRGH